MAVCRKCGEESKETANGVECGCGVKLANLTLEEALASVRRSGGQNESMGKTMRNVGYGGGALALGASLIPAIRQRALARRLLRVGALGGGLTGYMGEMGIRVGRGENRAADVVEGKAKAPTNEDAMFISPSAYGGAYRYLTQGTHQMGKNTEKTANWKVRALGGALGGIGGAGIGALAGAADNNQRAFNNVAEMQKARLRGVGINRRSTGEPLSEEDRAAYINHAVPTYRDPKSGKRSLTGALVGGALGAVGGALAPQFSLLSASGGGIGGNLVSRLAHGKKELIAERGSIPEHLRLKKPEAEKTANWKQRLMGAGIGGLGGALYGSTSGLPTREETLLNMSLDRRRMLFAARAMERISTGEELTHDERSAVAMYLIPEIRDTKAKERGLTGAVAGGLSGAIGGALLGPTISRTPGGKVGLGLLGSLGAGVMGLGTSRMVHGPRQLEDYRGEFPEHLKPPVPLAHGPTRLEPQKGEIPESLKSKKASLSTALNILWAEADAPQEKTAAAYFYNIKKPVIDAELLGAKFCKMASVAHKDPWELASEVTDMIGAYGVLSKTAANPKIRELAQFYCDWTDETLVKAAFLGSVARGVGRMGAAVTRGARAAKGVSGAARTAMSTAPKSTGLAGELRAGFNKGMGIAKSKVAPMTQNQGRRLAASQEMAKRTGAPIPKGPRTLSTAQKAQQDATKKKILMSRKSKGAPIPGTKSKQQYSLGEKALGGTILGGTGIGAMSMMGNGQSPQGAY